MKRMISLEFSSTLRFFALLRQITKTGSGHKERNYSICRYVNIITEKHFKFLSKFGTKITRSLSLFWRCQLARIHYVSFLHCERSESLFFTLHITCMQLTHLYNNSCADLLSTPLIS